MRRLAAVVVVLSLGVSCTAISEVASRRVRGGPDATAPPSTAPERRVQAAATGLVRIDGCDVLLDHLRAEALERVGPYGLDGGVFTAMPQTAAGDSGGARALSAETATGGASDSSASAPVAGQDYSTTNVQEAGVDEPDIVKSDGRRVLALASGNLYVLTIDGGTPRVVGSLAMARPASEMLLSGDRAVLVGSGFGGSHRGGPEPAVDMAIAPGPSGTTVTVVDVSDATRPRVTHTLDVDGWYVSARLADGLVRLVVRSNGPELAFTYPEGRSERAAKERNAQVVRSSTIDDWTASYSLTDVGSNARTSGNLVPCERTYRPVDFSGFSQVSVVTLDPANPQPRDSTAVVGAGEIVYASAENLYVTSNRWQPNTDGASGDTTRRSIPAPVSQTTEIHRFATGDRSTAEYRSSGSIDGHVLNQFSLSEHDGYLRVATTVDAAATSESAVVVLADRDGKLAEVGRVGGLGKGERIYAVRFMGPVGYVVTFRQIDPLYTIDLADPTAPRVVGELKIPGYSAYLHPIGNGHLLGIGQDATAEGRVTGTQVSVFDVRDPANPKRVHQHALGGHSEAEYDHHAFLWWAATDLAVVPVQEYDGATAFGGVAALRVRVGDGIEEVGRMQHDDAPTFSPIRRSLVVGDVLLTMSDFGVASNDMRTLARRGWAAF